MTKKLYFNVEKADILYESPNSQFATANIQAFSTGKSLHETTCDIETLKRTAPTLFEKPIIFEYDSRLRDFGSHGNSPIISGFVVPDSATFEQLPDGRTGLNVTAKIWKKYAQRFINVFKETGTKKKSVSVEMTIYKYEETSDGLMNLLDFVYEAICVLGDYVTPASPGADIQMLSFAKEENEAYKEVFKKEFSDKYHSVDFSIPDEVKANCKNGLTMYKETNSGGTSVSLAYARHIVKETHSTPERIKQAHKYHSGKHDNESEVSFNLWGGSHGRDWSVLLSGEIDEIDSKQITYFNNKELTVEEKQDYSRMEENKDMTKQEEMAKEEAKIPKEEVFEEEKKETPAEEKKEPAAEEKKEETAKEEPKKEEAKKEEPKKANMSLNENLDVAALLEFLKLETQTYRELVGGIDDSINYSINASMGEIAKGSEAKTKIVTDAMISYMKNVSKKLAVFADANATYAEENKKLKEFKDQSDTEKKSFEVDTVLKEAMDAGMPEGELENCKMEAANFSLEDIDSYKNMVKAKAFKYFGKKKTAKSGVTRIGLPFTAPQYKEPSLWK